jgi:hypothetical protein
MKKYFIMLVMLFTMNAVMFAEDNNVNEVESVEKYDFNVNTRKLASFLELSEDQMDAVEHIATELSNDMQFAFYENSKDSRKKVVTNAINKNVKHMSYVLNDIQYHKYLVVFNATLRNKGF